MFYHVLMTNHNADKVILYVCPTSQVSFLHKYHRRC